MKRAFEVNFFLISKVLSFRHTKHIGKNVAGTTFNGDAGKKNLGKSDYVITLI